MPDNHQQARRIAFELVPETCPPVHSAGTEFVAKLTAYIDRQSWSERLSKKQRVALDVKIGDLVSEFADNVKTVGTLPLRTALIRSIEDHLVLHPESASSTSQEQLLSAA